MCVYIYIYIISVCVCVPISLVPAISHPQMAQAPHERWPTAFPDPPRPPDLVVFQAPAPGDAWDIPKDPTKDSPQWM